MIRLVAEQDIPQWIEIIREVEPLFGSMLDDPNFFPAINEAIKGEMAFCDEDCSSKQINGVVIINRETNSIEWLAVSSQAKKAGIGTKLVQKAIENLNSKNDIIVQTFSSDVKEGFPARKLYEKFGFIDYKNAGKNPAGINTVIMIRKCG